MIPSHPTRRRRGAILLVVLAMLALFAVIGLSFVLFAESEGTAGRIYREDKSKLTPLDPADAAGRAIRQVVWGTDDVNSVARGHDLARLMYGDLGEVPYNGVGLVHEDLKVPTIASPAFTIDRAGVLNFTAFTVNGTRVVVDPEHVNLDPTAANRNLRSGAAVDTPNVLQAPPWAYVGKNAPYTYVDRNNAMVGLTDPATGRVVMPSAHRPSLFYPAPLNTTLATATPDWFGDVGSNTNWTTPAGRFKILRPRPEDHKPTGVTSTFPYPPFNPDGSRTGDVQNLRFADGTQKNDSVWLDLNLPVVTDQRGRRLVPLVAPLMVPLDGRVNLNASGNLVAGNHQSAAGFGPHEINPAWLSALATGGPLPAPASTNAQAYTFNRFGATGVTTTPTTPAGVGTLQFQPTGVAATPSVPAPSYAQVPWDGQAAAPPAYPTGTTSQPSYTAAAYSTTPDANHPALWNAYERAALLAGDKSPTTGDAPKTYPVSDLKLFGGRFSAKPSAYTSQSYLANSNRGTATAFLKEFLGNGMTYTAGQGTGPGAKGNLVRSLVTSVSNSRAVAGTGYNWGDGTLPATGTLTLTAGASGPARTDAAGTTPVPPQLDLTTLTANTGDAPGSTQATARNLRAVLGGVDVNRPLADYRTNLTQPLSNTNVPPGALMTPPGPPSQSDTATFDRQHLARDIFLRLAVATGARVSYDPNAAPGDYGQYVLPQPGGAAYQNTIQPVPPAMMPTQEPVTQAEYDALRWLAQLAANVVDFLDMDDVSTAFVWNPVAPLATVDRVSDPSYVPNFESVTPVAPVNRTALQDRVVYGMEKPRLVLNEVYAEVANKSGDAGRTAPNAAATQPFDVRVFAELLNPSTGEAEPAAMTAVHPLLQPLLVGGTNPATATDKFRGSVPLYYPASGATPAVNGYRLVVSNNGNSVRTDLQRADNVRGDVLTTPTSVKAVAPLDNLALGNPGMPPMGEGTYTSTQCVEPNDGSPSGATGSVAGRKGFAVVGPQYTRVTSDVAFTPDPMTGLYQMALQKPAGPAIGSAATNQTYDDTAVNALQYDAAPVTGAPGPLDQGELDAWMVKYANGQKHAVLLQRLANPYLPFDQYTNPYLTVDYATRVEVHDGAKNLKGMNKPARSAPTATGPFFTLDQRHATGRVQPYAGDEGDTQSPQLADIGPGDLQTSTTLTLRQTGTSGGAATSFFSHNTPGPTAGRFEWLAHLDRKLVSPAELLFVSAAKPHELTKRFGRPAATPLYHRHDIQHPADTTSGAPAGPLFAAGSPLYRALDALMVKPWTVNTPLGGRQAGKLNVNFLFDGDTTTASKLFRAVMDPQAGNAFTSADVDAIWKNLVTSRSPGWVSGTGTVNQTGDEAGATATAGTFDRPFKGLGTAVFGTSAAATGVRFTPGVNEPGLEDTLLRSLPPAPPPRLARHFLLVGCSRTRPPRRPARPTTRCGSGSR